MNGLKFLRITFFLISFSVLSFAHYSCKDEPSIKPKPIEISFTKNGELIIIKSENDSIIKKIDIEIADTPYKRETGLMYRNNLGAQQGMLFIFDEDQYLAFYMKNTNISLDLLYLNKDKVVVDIYENTAIMDETALPSRSIAKYVLEINAGMVKDWGITIGDYISF